MIKMIKMIIIKKMNKKYYYYFKKKKLIKILIKQIKMYKWWKFNIIIENLEDHLYYPLCI